MLGVVSKYQNGNELLVCDWGADWWTVFDDEESIKTLTVQGTS